MGMKVIRRGCYVTYYCPECGRACNNGGYGIYARGGSDEGHSIWTALYHTPSGCFNVEFGEENGPNMDQKTATALAWNYLVKHPTTTSGIHAIGHGDRIFNGW